MAILDDADQGYRENLEPIYDQLYTLDFLCTRSTWICKAKRGGKSGDFGDSDYVDWLKKISSQGFEIALHNVGNGVYLRNEIIHAFEEFKEVLGTPLRVHCNHHSNPDSIYWNPGDRFSWPISWLYRIFGKDRRLRYFGSKKGSPFYWADTLSENIFYVRNLVFNHLNTSKLDPYMPYWCWWKPEVPFWFSSTDMRDVRRFSQTLTSEALDQLVANNGICIAYTHFGSPGFLSEGRPSSEFVSALHRVKEKNIWIATVSDVLDNLLQQRGYYRCELTRLQALKLSFRWALERSGLI